MDEGDEAQNQEGDFIEAGDIAREFEVKNTVTSRKFRIAALRCRFELSHADRH